MEIGTMGEKKVHWKDLGGGRQIALLTPASILVVVDATSGLARWMGVVS